MPLVARCQWKILIAIAADEPIHTVLGTDIAAPAVPEHHGDGSALPMLVQYGSLSFEI
jgi:hypothetical protein